MFQSNAPEGDRIPVHLNTHSDQPAAPVSVRGDLLKWLYPVLRLIQILWNRMCQDIDSRCYPVQPNIAPPDTSKPMSLSAKLIADIWILKNKL